MERTTLNGLEREVLTTEQDKELGGYEYKFVVNCEHGLHVRPSTKISQLLSDYFDEAKISFQRFKGNRKGKLQYGKREGPIPISAIEILTQGVGNKSILYLNSKREIPEIILDQIKEILNYQYLF